MFLLSSALAAAINRTLSNQLARFAGSHIGVAAVGQRFVWRIDGEGKLSAVNALIDADCLMTFRRGRLHISGDGELLRVLSDLSAQNDWFVVISNLFGSRLAPAVLYHLEHGSAAVKRRIETQAVSPAEYAVYHSGIDDLYNRVRRLDERINGKAVT